MNQLIGPLINQARDFWRNKIDGFRQIPPIRIYNEP